MHDFWAPICPGAKRMGLLYRFGPRGPDESSLAMSLHWGFCFFFFFFLSVLAYGLDHGELGVLLRGQVM